MPAPRGGRRLRSETTTSGVAAVEEMDRDEADDGDGGPCWAEMTRAQRKKWKKWGGRRRCGASPQGRASPSQRDDDDRHLPGH